MKNKINFINFLVFLTIIAYFSFGLYHITNFVSADEQYWKYERIPQYWEAISSGKLKKTYINDKPGITLALISGIGLVFEDPLKHYIDNKSAVETYSNVSKTKDVNLAFRLPILIFNGLFIFFFFWILKKIFDPWIALWSVIFIALSPPLLGISQTTNPDALLWLFAAASIFSYLALLKLQERKFIILTSLFLGLSLLSKYVANILFPFFFILIFIYPVFFQLLSHSWRKFILDQLKYYFIICLGSAAVVSFFMPSVFYNFNRLYNLTVGFQSMRIIAPLIVILSVLAYVDIKFIDGKILNGTLLLAKKYRRIMVITIIFILAVFLILIIGRNFIPPEKWDVFQRIPFDAEELESFFSVNPEVKISFLDKIFLEYNPLVFSLTLTALIPIIFIWIFSIIKWNKNKYLGYTFALTLFIIIYLAGSQTSGVISTVRYNIMLYPIAAVLAGIGVWQVSQKFSLKNTWVTIAIFSFSVLKIYSCTPFYLNFTNSLLPKKYSISHAWGFGGYEAAEYINSKPNAENLTIWTDYYGVCPFIKGKCISQYRFDSNQYKIDYFVITRRGQIRMQKSNVSWIGTKPNQLDKNNPQWHVEWELDINNRPENYVKVYKSDI